MISDGQWDSVFGLGFGRLQGGFSADVVDTFQSISDDRVWIVAFGKKLRISSALAEKSVSSLQSLILPISKKPALDSPKTL